MDNTQQQFPEEGWGSDYLLVKDVQENDIVQVTDLKGFVLSYGKKKYSIVVSCNGHDGKMLNLNRKQFLQMFQNGVPCVGGKYQVKKLPMNGGYVLNFTVL